MKNETRPSPQLSWVTGRSPVLSFFTSVLLFVYFSLNSLSKNLGWVSCCVMRRRPHGSEVNIRCQMFYKSPTQTRSEPEFPAQWTNLLFSWDCFTPSQIGWHKEPRVFRDRSMWETLQTGPGDPGEFWEPPGLSRGGNSHCSKPKYPLQLALPWCGVGFSLGHVRNHRSAHQENMCCVF